MNKNVLMLGFIMGFLGCGSGIAQAAGLNCAEAHTRVEQAICADPVLLKLDRRLNQVYQADLAKANPAQRHALIATERHWLRDTQGPCRSETCFKQAYYSRLTQLQTFQAPIFVKDTGPYSLLSWGRERPLCQNVLRYLNHNPACNVISAAPEFTSPPWKTLNPRTHEELIEQILRYQTEEMRSAFTKFKPKKPSSAQYRIWVRDYILSGGQIRVWRTRLFSNLKQRYLSYGGKRYPVPRGVQTLVELRRKVHKLPACGSGHYFTHHRLFFVSPDLKRVDASIPREIAQALQWGALGLYRHHLYLIRNGAFTISVLRAGQYSNSYPLPYCAYHYTWGEK